MQEKLAFVFPGQGSQAVGMLAAHANRFARVGKVYQQASTELGYDLWAIVAQGPMQELSKTTYTQPALLAASYALWQIWLEGEGQKPHCLAGHSLGEYSALLCAQAIDFPAAVNLVAMRARLMSEAVAEGQGAMAAILGLDEAIVQDACKQAAQGEVVEAVNFNAPGQIVIAGNSSAVERAIALCKSMGARRAIKLPVSVPSHCQLMQSVADEFTAAIANTPIRSPQIPIIHNADNAMHSHPDDIRAALAAQLTHPVRWVQIIEQMVHNGITHFIECGPGNVLSGLCKRIDKGITIVSLSDVDKLTGELMI